MRDRRLSLSLGAVTMLVALLGLSSAANASSPPLITAFDCPSASGMINCTVEFTSDRPTRIFWRGGPGANLDMNKKTRSFRCIPRPGPTVFVSVEIIDDSSRSIAASGLFECKSEATTPPPRITPIFCRPALSGGLPGGNYFVCDVVWAGDGSPETVRWVNPQAKRQPVVTVNSAEGWTTASFDCNNPGGPDLTFGSVVNITNASGTMTTPATIPCGW